MELRFLYVGSDDTSADLVASGWTVEVGPMGTPEGDATALTGPGGTAIALLQVDRPGAMDAAYADETNTRAVR